MSTTDLAQLETAIRGLDGVLSVVILTDEYGAISQIEAFAEAGSDHSSVQKAIIDLATQLGHQATVKKIIVMELEAESLFGDRDSLEKLAEEADLQIRSRNADSAASELSALAGIELTAIDDAGLGPARDVAGKSGGPRLPVKRVLLNSTTETFEAEVTLGGPAHPEVSATATGGKEAHGLRPLAEATLQAASQLVGQHDIVLVDAMMIDLVGRQSVAVLVLMPDGLEVVGAALVRDQPVSEAAVRATLDAVNRRLMTP